MFHSRWDLFIFISFYSFINEVFFILFLHSLIWLQEVIYLCQELVKLGKGIWKLRKRKKIAISREFCRLKINLNCKARGRKRVSFFMFIDFLYFSHNWSSFFKKTPPYGGMIFIEFICSYCRLYLIFFAPIWTHICHPTRGIKTVSLDFIS